MTSARKIAATPEDVQRFFRSWTEAWSSGSADRVADCFTADASFDEPDTPQVLHGREKITGFVESIFTAFPDLSHELLGVFVELDGDRIADLAYLTGTMTGSLDPPGYAPTQHRIGFYGMAVFELQDGRAASYRGFFDMLDLGRQLGAVPPSGSRGERMGTLLQRLTARRMRARRR